MILVSVGTQLPFDRMIRAVDDWAAGVGGLKVVAQVGHSSYRPRALEARPFLSPTEFRLLQEQADLHVAHAGMGSILTALELGKPIVIMPRDHQLGEHRNGHQLATARRFAGSAGVHVAMDPAELVAKLDAVRGAAAMPAPPLQAPTELTSALTAFIAQDTGRTWRSLLALVGRR